MSITKFAGIRRFIRWVVTGEALAAADDQIEARTGWRPSEAIKRGVGWLLAAGGWLVWSLIASWLPWLQDQNWAVWAVAGLGLALLSALTLVLAVLFVHLLRRLFRPRQAIEKKQPGSVKTDSITHDNTPAKGSSDDTEAHEKLLSFVVRDMLPACQAHADLQAAVVSRIFYNNKYLQRTVLQGIRNDEDVVAFWSSYRRLLAAFGGSPPDDVPFGELVDCVDKMEKGYGAFCRETYELAQPAGIDLQHDKDFSPVWHEWYQRHERMVQEYEVIKLDRKFLTLFRPMRPSRWRDIPEPIAAQGDQSSARRTV